MKGALAAILIVLVAVGGVLATTSNENNSQKLNVTKEFYAGRPVKILTTKHGYSLLDLENCYQRKPKFRGYDH